MQDFLNAFWRWLVVWFVLALIFVHSMENAGYFDSTGIWYTLYCATGIALPIAAVFAFFGKTLLSNWWSLRR